MDKEGFRMRGRAKHPRFVALEIGSYSYRFANLRLVFETVIKLDFGLKTRYFANHGAANTGKAKLAATPPSGGAARRCRMASAPGLFQRPSEQVRRAWLARTGCPQCVSSPARQVARAQRRRSSPLATCRHLSSNAAGMPVRRWRPVGARTPRVSRTISPPPVLGKSTSMATRRRPAGSPSSNWTLDSFFTTAGSSLRRAMRAALRELSAQSSESSRNRGLILSGQLHTTDLGPLGMAADTVVAGACDPRIA